MAGYLLGRVLRGLLSVLIVVAVVMVLIYSCLDRNLIFANDPVFTKQKSNAQEVYKMQQWEYYGYVDFVPYGDYLVQLGLAQSVYDQAVKLGDKPAQDSTVAADYIRRFTAQYEAEGYTVVRLTGKKKGNTANYLDGGEPRLYAYRDVPLILRLRDYLTGILRVDNIHAVKEDVGERGLTFTWFDPVYGGEKFSPAIMGNGTRHKYLLYFDDQFPFLHQNFLTISLGRSYSVNQGVDVFDTMTDKQGSRAMSMVTYPSGNREYSADDLHSAVHVAGSYAGGDAVIKRNFVDDYTGVTTRKTGFSKLGYSFVIGILSVALAYALAVPMGIFMARRKDRLADRLGTVYIVFIMAVPSLAYIFLFKALGGWAGLPTSFDMENPTRIMYVLPVISLALPSAANLMKWLRRYMIDQMHAEYVRFARGCGLREGLIFRAHVLKNAAIPMVHGIPAAVLGALVGAILTERVYVVPGAGNLLTGAINSYDNGVIVGVTLFYAVISVTSVILGDVLISAVDPRISFGRKGR
ncbi:MAG: ABC transporter permease [Oscillospiraceae bacterium]|nr:ABC transporter permease [Oscillospiraceae bacterium]